MCVCVLQIAFSGNKHWDEVWSVGYLLGVKVCRRGWIGQKGTLNCDAGPGLSSSARLWSVHGLSELFPLYQND